MVRGPVKHVTYCLSCEQEVGALNDGFSQHNSVGFQTTVWKTSVHRNREGQRCPGSRLQVDAVITMQVLA